MRRALALFSLVAAVASQGWSQPKIDAIVDAASFQKGLPAGGALATMFLSGFTNRSRTKPGTYVASSPLPYQLAGFSVFINYGWAPILAVVITPSGQSMNVQINFQVPLERNASLRTLGPSGYGGSLSAGNEEGGGTITPLPEIPQWGGFFSDSTGYAIAQHASDYSPVTPDNPAHPGETIIVYANDFFGVWPPPPVGSPVPQQPLFQILLGQNGVIRGPGYLFLQEYPNLDYKGRSFASTPALLTPFQGLAPALIGVEQINFVVPADQKPGDWALFFNIGTCPEGHGLCSNYGFSSPYVKLPVR